MNVSRAQEILTGKQEINVNHNGKQVWIDSVDAANQTARVHCTSNPSDVQTVQVQELQEA
ncbi:H-type small acid-soluble spore protein [Paenibacillus sp. MBLB4367]|uniref:H-type small acid-soluble spore protein n=1 Tax=Paenibacillus sp. MBLB4367 TaxID=3384767 RepID=UPI003907F032